MPPKSVPKPAPRSPLALPENLTMKLSYCAKCKIPLGVGGLPGPASHADPKTGDIHEGELIELDAAERKSPGETPGKFLDRLMKKYVK